jgi:hypothetical protein
LAYSSEEREEAHKGGSPLPPQPSCGILNKDNDDKRLKTHLAPSLRRSSQPISQGKKKKKTKRSSSNKTSLIFHCCKKRGHSSVSCWYLEASFLWKEIP